MNPTLSINSKTVTNQKVIAVTVNWNRYEDTCACLDSLLTQQGVDVKLVIVDNGSDDNSEKQFRQHYPQATIIRSETNLGFAGGFNLGILAALDFDPVYIMIINNDTIALPGMINSLVDEMDSSEVGICSPVIYYYSEPTSVWSSGGNFTKALITPINAHHKNSYLHLPVYRTFLSGCCLLMKRDLINSIGLFDESFFLYYEDLDYCLRVLHSPWRMKLIPAAKLLHKVSISSEGFLSPRERYYMGLSSGLYYRKHMNWTNIWFIIPFRFVSAILWSVRLIVRGNWASLRAYWKGLFKGWAGKRHFG